jgi:cytochrome b6-f complex iron-sulfur subunit
MKFLTGASNMVEMNRREFIDVVAGTCAVCVCGSPGAWAAEEKPAPVDVGERSAFAKDGLYDKFAQSQKIFLVRGQGQLYAVTAVCTHKQFALGIDANDKSQLKCSKHGSIFKIDGTVAKSPARKPLARFGISVNDQKHVIVDKTRVFEEKDWKEAGSFVKV